MVELQIGSKKIETATGSELSLVLNKSIADFDDISARSSSYSFDFEIPPTQSNNEILFGVSDVNAVGDVGRVNAVLLIDGVESDRGVLFAFESELDGNYTATYQSGLVTWAEEISNLRLNQLFWRGVTGSGTINAEETFSTARYSVLNNSNSATNDLIYPLVNRNNDGAGEDSRPQIYLRSFITNLFTTIGWSVSGGFLEKDEIKGNVTIQDIFSNNFEFKGVTIDPPFNFEVDADIIENSLIHYNSNKTYPNFAYILGNTASEGAEPDINNFVALDGFYNVEVDDDGSNFDSLKYTAPYKATYSIILDPRELQVYYSGFTGSGFFPTNGTSIVSPKVDLLIFVNNIQVDSVPINDISNQYGMISEIEINLLVGDEVKFRINNFGENVNGTPISLIEYRVQLGTASSLKIQRKQVIELGEDFVINNHLPPLNCLNLLQDIKLAYNLMFITDEKTKKVTIETWNDFYKNIGLAKNYTSKLDLTVAPVINRLSDYTKEIVYRYKEDSSDGYLERWQKINERIYGRYRQDLVPANRFEEGQNLFETKLISPSIQGTLNNSDIIVSLSKNDYEDDTEVGLNTGYNTRLYYTVKGKQYYNDGSERSSFNITTSIMESYGNVPVLDNNQLTFNGANGLVARNWAKTLATIQLGIRVPCNFLLSKYEFFNLDFSTPIYLEYPTKLKGYYLIESVNNYELTDDNLYSAECTIIKYKDFVGVSIDTSQGTNINENVNGTQQVNKTSVYTITDEGQSTETINRVYTFSGDGTIQNVII
tara:strand:+ start:5921 stop:8224 length:2304 start_codon:yes stop_codon:yes gene_type:complete